MREECFKKDGRQCWRVPTGGMLPPLFIEYPASENGGPGVLHEELEQPFEEIPGDNRIGVKKEDRFPGRAGESLVRRYCETCVLLVLKKQCFGKLRTNIRHRPIRRGVIDDYQFQVLT